jgi:hypothetical protein
MELVIEDAQVVDVVIESPPLVDLSVAESVVAAVVVAVEGERGEVGPAGSIGPVGPTGATGATGAAGAAGSAATIAVGTVTTGNPGSSATVTNAGTSSAAVLNFSIPTGATGASGAPGADALWNFTGAYSGGAAYAVGDVATHEGRTWYRLNSNGGNVGDTPSEGTFWTLIAAKGDTGTTGSPGVKGDTGDVGPASTVPGPPGEKGDTGAAGTTSWTGITDKPTDLVTLTGTQELTNKNLTGAGNTFPTFNQSTTGNAATATALQTARTINGVSFNGSANITVADSTKEPVITAGTTAQYYRGDKTFQTLDKTAVGLGNVDNTSNATERAATATLTNKTLTNPRIGVIHDNNGNTGAWIGGTGSAVNFLQMGNAATGGRALLRAQGETNVGLGIVPRGTGTVVLQDSAFAFVLEAVGVASSVNYLLAGNAATGTAPYLQGWGSDANVGLNLRTRGTGTVQVNGVDAITTTGTQTLSNKRITSRIGTVASTATPSIDINSFDQYNITALALAITSVTVTGTPTDGQRLMVRIKGDATPRAIAWGASFLASGVAPLLATTVANRTHLCSFLYDSAAAKWVAVVTDDVGY